MRLAMQETTITLIVIVGFVIVFPLFWMAIVWLISRMSGWARLARQNPARGPITGDVFRWCSARIRFLSSYQNCLTVTVSSAGIHMQPVIFFRIGHDPIFISWKAVRNIDRQNNWLFPAIRLALENSDIGAPTAIVFYGRCVVENLERHYTRN
jgi:hypothetical protein